MHLLVDSMMWIEAVLASMLLGLTMLLLLQSPPASSPFLDQATTLQLEDRAALLIEFGSDPIPGSQNLTNTALSDDLLKEKIFSSPQAFCYRWHWSSTDSLAPDTAVYYSDDTCSAVFDAHPATMRSISRGAWRNGSLQFLHLSQAPFSN